MAIFQCKWCGEYLDDHVCVPYGDDLLCEDCEHDRIEALRDDYHDAKTELAREDRDDPSFNYYGDD